MKKLFIISMALILSSLAYTQVDDMPQNVKNAFKARYPQAKGASWYNEGSNIKIEFSESTDMFTAIFSEKGNWIETSKFISDNEIPQKVITAIDMKFPGSFISVAEFVEDGKNGKFYRINSYDEDAEYILDITGEGTIISSQKKSNASDYDEG